jgi:hypothetical protein
MDQIHARYVYDLERQLPNRNFAKDHSFEEWMETRRLTVPRSSCEISERSTASGAVSQEERP